MKRILILAASVIAVSVTTTTGLVGCSGSGGGSADAGSSTAAALTISGSLSGGSSFLPMSLNKSANSSFAVNLSDLEIYAIAFTTPPVIARAAVGTDGSFSVSLPGAKGSSVTAVFRDTTNNNEVGTVTFRDTSTKDMSGNNYKDSSSIVLSDNVSLGNLTLGDDGKVVVDVAEIATAVAAPAASTSAFDMSGVWKAKPFSNPPTGYITTCAAGTPQNDCEGLPENAEIALIRIKGKEFTPNQNACDQDADPVVCHETNDGTVGTKDKYALGVWEASGVTACDHKTGFTADEARAGGRIHVDTTALPTIGGTAVTMGAMTSYSPYFWIKGTATATRDFYDCRGVMVAVDGKQVPGYACKGSIKDGKGTPEMDDDTDTGNDGWMVNLGNGGCFDANNKPVMVKNWGGLTPSGQCQHVTTGLPAGFSAGTCNYNGDPDGDEGAYPGAIAFTCKWVNGQFADSNGNPNLQQALTLQTNEYLTQAAVIPAMTNGQPTKCKDGYSGDLSGLTFAEAQCFAQYYEQNRNSFQTTCAPRPRFNWGASTVKDFYRVEFRPKPDSQFLMDILTYDPTGSLATLDTEERESFTVPSGSDSSVTCEMARKIVFNFKKVTDTTAIVDIRFSGRMASTAAACQGIAKVALANVEYNKNIADRNQHRRAVNNADLEYMLVPQAMIFSMEKQ